MASPYADVPPEKWLEITQKLIAEHPLSTDNLISAVLTAWAAVWNTDIGQGTAKIPLREIDPPATVIGYFFEKVLAKELAARYPEEWIGGTNGTQKDLHFIPKDFFSIEVKSSGQMGLKIFGNRSYGQEVVNEGRAKKDKSGYYLTINFVGETLNLVRFGWIDGSDWMAQKAATGQMAGLGNDVYAFKLIPIAGDYTLDAPLDLLSGVGLSSVAACAEIGIHSVRAALANPEKLLGKLKKVYAAAVAYETQFGVKKDALQAQTQLV